MNNWTVLPFGKASMRAAITQPSHWGVHKLCCFEPLNRACRTRTIVNTMARGTRRSGRIPVRCIFAVLTANGSALEMSVDAVAAKTCCFRGRPRSAGGLRAPRRRSQGRCVDFGVLNRSVRRLIEKGRRAPVRVDDAYLAADDVDELR